MSTEVFKRPNLPLVSNGNFFSLHFIVVLEIKRARFDQNAVAYQQLTRTSNLLAPIMLLTGHDGEIYSGKFSPDGQCCATAGYDLKIRKY